MFARWYAEVLKKKLERPFVHLLFGARQSGKSTLLRSLLPPDALVFDLSNPGERSALTVDPSGFIQACRALPAGQHGRVVFVDEAQAVPALFDAVQHLYDGDKNRWRFILCGSSARKLRATGANLLPGRCFLHHLYPLTLTEQPVETSSSAGVLSPLPFPWPGAHKHKTAPPQWNLEERLAFGSLPGVVGAASEDRVEILKAYTTVHLEEEIRREAWLRDWGAFLRFLQLAARESGQITNFSSIAGVCGLSEPTVKKHYQLLEDMFMAFSVPPFSRSPRRNLLSSSKFLFFDLGIRHAAAGLTPSVELVRNNPGPVFEQWVGIELWKRLRYLGGTLYHQRTRDGAEVDFIVEHEGALSPVEVKWTERPTLSDARHLLTFISENPDQAKKGYVVCRCPRPLELHEKIIALPWWCL